MGNDIFVDENPIVLFSKAEKNIAAINSFLKDKDVPEKTHYDSICYNVTQAVEKYLKGFIVANNGKVKKIHNLDRIIEIAESLNNNFSNIKNECIYLSNYTSEIRYSNKFKIEKHEITEILKHLGNVYNFEPLKNMRKAFQKENDYINLPEFDFLNNKQI